MTFTEIISAVEELCDGRVFGTTKHLSWINRIRKSVGTDFEVAGLNGLYFLYKEATVKNGSVATQPRYAIPNDFIDDLSVFYDGNLLAKAPPGMLNITIDQADTATTPTHVRMMGTEFDIRPIPSQSGDEIKLLYNGYLYKLTSSDTGYEDYFMKHFPDFHIYGEAISGAMSLLDHKRADTFRQFYNEERKKIAYHNRRHYMKGIRMRFQTWDEYEEMKTIVFPQFST